MLGLGPCHVSGAEDMHPTPYLFFAGDCYQAMTLYAKALGGEVLDVMRNSDAPPEDRMPGGDDLVMNMVIKTDAGMILASDNSPEHYDTPKGFRLQLEAASIEEFDRLYGLLGEDARAVEMPVSETFWAERFTMFTDRFGTPWMLNYTGGKM